jgi:hypothetical protein
MQNQIIETALAAFTAYLQTREKETNYRLFFRSQREEERIQQQILELNDNPSFRPVRDALRRKLRMQQHITANLARDIGVSVGTNP